MSCTVEIVDRLTRQKLLFGRDRGEQPYTRSLVLESNGTIGGYQHSNEVLWKFRNDRLHFCNAEGGITTSFDAILKDEPDHLVLRGRCFTAGGDLVHHILSGFGWAQIIGELRKELYSGDDPYCTAQSKYVDNGYGHSNLAKVPEFADAILKIIQPRFWLEVGSMVGGSAIVTAAVARQLGLRLGIVAIDPFCGDINMWAWERGLRERGEWRYLRLEDGAPTIYQRFLANVVEAGFRNTILPIPTTSIVGMRLLERLKREQRIHARPEVIYLDSAHEVDETFLELQSAWSLLPEGGVIVGDDWDWLAVQTDVRRFAASVELNAEIQQAITNILPGSIAEDGILRYRHQWLIAK